MNFKGYQTLHDRSNPEYFEQNGPKKCTQPKAWLGPGYYFWDSNIHWAHEWGRHCYAGEYMIFQGDIVYNEAIFDIYGNPTHKRDLLDWAQMIIEKVPSLDPKTLTVANVIEFAKKNAKFCDVYSAIRAADYPNRQIKFIFTNERREYTMIGIDRVQFCLITKKNLLSHSFLVVYPEDYKLN